MSTKCTTPFYVDTFESIKGIMTKVSVPVPCGKCLGCRTRRSSGWSFRLSQEERRSSSAAFVTLTYNQEHVPLTANKFMTLKKRDVQLFFKRLRKLNNTKIKYYVAGEYGSHFNRPHYHIIMFNADISTIEQAWKCDSKPIGTIHVGSVSGASIGYTLKYISKPSKIPMHANDDRQKEFSLMSKGLGANYITEKSIQWHKQKLSERFYVPLLDGKKASLPRYYKQKMYSESELEKIKIAMKAKSEAEENKLMLELGDNYHYSKWLTAKAAHTKMIKKFKMSDSDIF